jgi:ribA/ribD-fused uncharacterized protein
VIDKFTWKGDTGAWVHGPFSNFYHSPFDAPWWGDAELTGMGTIYTWPTAEHYYQAAKFERIPDVEKLLESDSPGRSKKLGRSLTNRGDWPSCSIRAMRDTLALKFAFGTPGGDDLATTLLETGDELLVEGNTWGDRFYGMVKNAEGVYEGQNWLGVLLMARRAELRADVGPLTLFE